MTINESGIPRSRFLAVAAIALFAIAAAFPRDAQDRTAPENANEARLNRLQPPGPVMDIIGAAPGMAIAEWVKRPGERGKGTAPETMKARMEEAGFVLDRIDKTLENNRMYIYLFRLPPAEGFSALTGPYLGQKPPGMTPELFAPGFVSTKFGELNSVFSPDGKDFYFSRRGIPGRPSALMVTRMEEDKWTEPRPLPFSGTYDDIDLFLCPDNQRLIFCSSRPQAGGKEDRMNHDFWVVRRNGAGWGEPKPFALAAVSPAEDYFPIVTLSGTLYFNSQREGRGTNDIYASKCVDGEYLPAEKLPPPINTSYREFDAYVTPDEGTILFSSERPGGFGGSDIYVSFRDGQGRWSEPANLGPGVNSENSEYGATISPDGRYLFFTSSKTDSEDIYWVSAEIVERLPPGNNKATETVVPHEEARAPLAENLKILEPLANKTWIFVKEQQQDLAFDMVTEWKPIWKGTVVRYTSDSQALDSHVEGYFFWDAASQKIAFFRISNKDVFESGFVTQEGGAVLLTGSITLADRKLDLKYSLEINPDGRLIDKAYTYKNGAWKMEHAAEFEAKDSR